MPSLIGISKGSFSRHAVVAQIGYYTLPVSIAQLREVVLECQDRQLIPRAVDREMLGNRGLVHLAHNIGGHTAVSPSL